MLAQERHEGLRDRRRHADRQQEQAPGRAAKYTDARPCHPAHRTDVRDSVSQRPDTAHGSQGTGWAIPAASRRRAYFTAWARADRARSVSDGVPTEMRRCWGKPQERMGRTITPWARSAW